MAASAQTLVGIPSANPPGDTSAVAKAATRMIPESYAVTCHEPVSGFVSLVASRKFGGDGPTLVLCGHLDVVPPGESWTRDPWVPELVGGRLYGRGSADMKGAVAAMLVAAQRIEEEASSLIGQLILALVADEESGGERGAGAIIDSIRGADGVIVGEPSNGRLCVSHRGMCFVELVTRGRSTHASVPHRGVNAVMLMVEVLHSLKGLNLTYRDHEFLGRPTFALGTTISGGTKTNVIPEQCSATLDVRKVSGMTDTSVLEDILRHLERAGLADAVEMRVVTSGEPAEVDPDAAIVQVAAAAFEQEFGVPPELCGMDAATDGWWFANRAGVPTVMALGPGSIEDCHIADESVEVAELEAYARVYADVARSFLAVVTN